MLRAIKEYDRLGPERFLSEHGFAPTTTYELVWEDAVTRRKRSWAQPTNSPPASASPPRDFEGGKSGAVKVLGQLGFAVEEKRRPARGPHTPTGARRSCTFRRPSNLRTLIRQQNGAPAERRAVTPARCFLVVITY